MLLSAVLFHPLNEEKIVPLFIDFQDSRICGSIKAEKPLFAYRGKMENMVNIIILPMKSRKMARLGDHDPAAIYAECCTLIMVG